MSTIFAMPLFLIRILRKISKTVMQQKLREIKIKFRQAMNGIVSHHMRSQGADYKINFGLTLPLLKRIATEIQPDAQLAEALWADTAVRESMMLAPMVYPLDEFTEAEADRWLDTMPNTEVADICCKYLFGRLPFALQKALVWYRSDNPLHQYTAFQLATAWLIAHPDSGEKEAVAPIAEVAITQATTQRDNRAFAAVNLLKQAVHDDTLARYILATLRAKTGSNDRAQILLDELTEEQILFREFSGGDSV